MSERKELDFVHIDAFDLDDAWFQCLLKILEHGHVYKIDRGSYAGQHRLEFDFVSVHVKNPAHPSDNSPYAGGLRYTCPYQHGLYPTVSSVSTYQL